MPVIYIDTGYGDKRLVVPANSPLLKGYGGNRMPKKQKIKGYIAKVGPKGFKAYSFEYFTNRRAAVRWVKSTMGIHHLRKPLFKQFYRVEPKVLTKCRCGKLMPFSERECLKCEKMRMG